jgi:beta-lactamase regulating signal transducer with metallopeptidase domain
MMLEGLVPFDLLWRTALAVIPLALLVAAACRWLPCRPSTRHAMWVLLLLALIALPVVPARTPSRLLDLAATLEVEEPVVDRPAGITPVVMAASPDEVEPASRRQADRRDEWNTNAANAVSTVTGPSGSVLRQSSHRVEPAIERSRQDREFAKYVGAWTPSRVTPGTPPLDAPTDSTRSDVNWSLAEPAPGAATQETTAAPSPAMAPGVFLTGVKQWLMQLVAVRDAVMGLPPIPVSLWLAGATLLIVGVVARRQRALRLLRRATPAPAEVVRTVHREAAQLGLRRAPYVLMIDARVSPMVWCGRPSRLILPSPLWTQLDDIGRRAVILHELAHLRRRDHWVSWAELLIGAIYWWHPVVWFVRRRIREEADLCCDAWVTALLPTGRRAYAQALLETRKYISAAPPSTPVVGLGANTMRATRFARRLTMVMTKQTTPRLSMRGAALVGALSVGAYLAVPVLACPPERDKPKNVKPDKPVRPKLRIVPGATTAPADDQDETTFEEFMRRRQRDAEGGEPQDEQLEKHLRELERELEKLYERLERSFKRDAHADELGEIRELEALRELEKLQELAEIEPEVLGMLEPMLQEDAAPEGGDDCAKVRAKTYKTAHCVQQVLNNLMRRDDVPVLIRPLDDAIEVHGNLDTHRRFDAFITMISGSGNDIVREYEMSAGKLELVKELMAMQEVPILVQLREDSIRVHGTELEQKVFKSFVEMIDPDDTRRPRRVAEYEGETADAVESVARARDMQRMYERAARREAQRHTMDARLAQIEAQRAALAQQMEAFYEHAEAFEMQAEDLEAQAEQFEDEADEFKDEADDLLEEAEELQEEAEEEQELTREERRELADQVRSLQAQARQIEQQAKAMQNQARSVMRQARSLQKQSERAESQADRCEEQADRLEERADKITDELDEIAERETEREDSAGER